MLGQTTNPVLGNGGLLPQTANHSRFGVANHQSYSDQLLPGMEDRAALVVWGARPWQFGGLGARPCFLVVCLPKPPPTISIAAVCNGKPPKFTGCCTKQPKRNTLFAVLLPKPPTTIWIVAVCYGKPPQFTVCCTKQLKRSLLLTALPPKPLTECMGFPRSPVIWGRHRHHGTRNGTRCQF